MSTSSHAPAWGGRGRGGRGGAAGRPARRRGGGRAGEDARAFCRPRRRKGRPENKVAKTHVDGLDRVRARVLVVGQLEAHGDLLVFCRQSAGEGE